MQSYRELIYGILNGLTYPDGFPSVQVYAERPEVLESFPCITYNVSSNIPQYDLDKVLSKQDVIVVVDVWTDTSLEGDTIVSLIEAAMKAQNFLMTFCSDIIDPSGGSHISLRFNY